MAEKWQRIVSFFVHGLMANFIYLPGYTQHNCLQDEITVKDKNIHPLKNESLN